jgi:hypothetical protein
MAAERLCFHVPVRRQQKLRYEHGRELKLFLEYAGNNRYLKIKFVKKINKKHEI